MVYSRQSSYFDSRYLQKVWFINVRSKINSMNAVHLLHKKSNFIGIRLFFIILLQFCVLLLPAQDSIPCLMPWIPPLYSVSEIHWDAPNSFWQNGGHVPENLVNEDTTDYARAHIMLTGS